MTHSARHFTGRVSRGAGHWTQVMVSLTHELHLGLLQNALRCINLRGQADPGDGRERTIESWAPSRVGTPSRRPQIDAQLFAANYFSIAICEDPPSWDPITRAREVPTWRCLSLAPNGTHH